MSTKQAFCGKCDTVHERPVGKKCKNSTVKEATGSVVQNVSDDVNQQILTELQALSGRMSKLEKKVNDQDSAPSRMSTSSRSASLLNESDQEDDMVMPSLSSLKSSQAIQRQVDARIKQLQQTPEKGKFRSQRGGSDNVFVKHEVAWPQNHILGGSTKSRVQYDSLSISQWVSGFATIIRDEANEQVRDKMLEYLADIMEDSHDFGWASAKASHAVLLCKMEEGKINWWQTDKIDRVRRVHAQKICQQSNMSGRRQSLPKIMPCRYFQKGQCSHKSDHETNGQAYRHVCSFCFSQGKSNPHALKDCRRSNSKNE